MTRLYFVYVAIFCIAGCVDKQGTDTSNGYTKYNLSLVETITLPKVHGADQLYDVRFLSDGRAVYYSKTTDSLLVYDIETFKSTAFKVVDKLDRDLGVQIGLSEINDSIIVVAYHTIVPYVDNTIFELNLVSGEKSYAYRITDTNFIQESIIPLDSFSNNQKITLYKYRMVSNEIMTVPGEDAIVLPIDAGGFSKDYKDLRTTTKSLLKVYRDSSKGNDFLDVRFSMVNNLFNDSLNRFCFKWGFLYWPTLNKIDEHRFIVTYGLGTSFVLYNTENDKSEVIKAFPEFLNPDPALFMNHDTRDKREVYYFAKIFSNDGSGYLYRKVNIPLHLSDSQSTTFTDHTERFIVYSKAPEIEVVGIIDEEINGRVVGIDGNDYMYVLDIEASAASDSLFYVKKYKIIKGTKGRGYYKPSFIRKKNENKGNYSKYLSQIDRKLLQQDTIPLLCTFGVCGTCIVKLGLFLQGVQDNNMVTRPLVLISSNKFQGNKYYQDYSLGKINGVFRDSTSALLTYMDHPGAFGYFIKSENGYRFEKVHIDELDRLFYFINPKLRLVGDICVPYKQY